MENTITFQRFFLVSTILLGSWNLEPETLSAQYTGIPDPNFEQALIDLGIDSDGTVDGQVLTGDIENVTVLNVSVKQISDLTGIEDFAVLEELDVSANNITHLDFSGNSNLNTLDAHDNYYLQSLDVSGNPQLEFLYCYDVLLQEIDLSNNALLRELVLGIDYQPSESNDIKELDLSNNPLLEKLWLVNISSLKYVNLKSGNNSLLTDVEIYCYIEGWSCGPDACVEVDDTEAAQNGQYPYYLWEVIVHYVEDCSLSTPGFEAGIIHVYPNPASNRLYLSVPDGIDVQTLSLLDIHGRTVRTYSPGQRELDHSGLAAGQYFLEITTGAHIDWFVKVVKR